MQAIRRITLPRVLSFLAALLVVKVTVSVVLQYGSYFPPNFQADFLRGREAYFWGAYRVAFYGHIVSGPVSLLLGLILIGERFRLDFPTWHRRLGRIQGVNVLFVVAPTGLWMARYAQAGPIAGAGLASLAILTATCTALGWRTAVQRRFTAHRLWMSRTFLLLCSAVVLRLIGGLATTLEFGGEWLDPLATWGCWIFPLTVFELSRRWRNRSRSATAKARTEKDTSLEIATTQWSSAGA